MKPGTRLKSAACDTEVMVIRTGGGQIECGGAPMADKPASGAKAAETGEIQTPKGRAKLVEMMLASPRLEAGMRAFFDDMLGFDELSTLAKDATVYPAFTGATVEDAHEQTLRTMVDHLLVKNRDYRDLFTSRATFLSPALAALLLQPKGAAPDPLDRVLRGACGWFFRGFNRAFGAASNGYGKTVGGLVTRKSLVMMVYMALVAATYGMFTTVPSGFVPAQDKQYLIGFAQLPDGVRQSFNSRRMFISHYLWHHWLNEPVVWLEYWSSNSPFTI